ncbi:gamma-glutamyltranspeptidase [Conidiobolus coronatus NRRL 28638]|uniref:Glutathione hydrolase n=1 Tax=Conidiobolus coronatus (strain ATCC 28846 / CBS 209.66 / NRRL 28638) TaxID=796925 RepID=A0A137PGT5_CONC2|nr:gamma-glutamyltranspeptidase [Conidiobolus coronatus NRRL 28638]|eukprot:KXN74219.1 gamma-glutamyltranspeptidase [Conidiobolus coronatus NRRL 28638]
MKTEAQINNNEVALRAIKIQKINLTLQILMVFILYNINVMVTVVTYFMRLTTGYKRPPFFDAITYEMLVFTLALNPVITVSFQPETGPVSKIFSGNNGGVASENGICSQIGVGILKAGGNAVDSIIATGICQGTLNPFSSGIGGGGFAVLRKSCGTIEFIDFRETAPQLSNSTMYNTNYNASLVGGLAVAVPSEVKGYELLHTKYGKLPWNTLFEPSIELSEVGFKAGKELVKRLNSNKDWILNNTEFLKIFAPNGTLVGVGDIVYRKNLAFTLKKIAEEGSKGFYEGEVAQDIVNTIQTNGGIMSLEDLKNYTAIFRQPSTGKFMNSTIYSTTAPSSGSILINILELLDSVIRSNGTGTQVDLYHKFVECLKFGYAARTNLADPGFNSTITAFEKNIISEQFIENLRSKVDLKHTHNYTYYEAAYAPEEMPGTTHLSTTVNMDFGSQLMTPATGIVLNDEMNDFSMPNVSNGFNLPPSVINVVKPGKRPQSSTAPAIVVKSNGEIIALGGAGGSKITSSVAQVLLEILLNDKNIMQAVDSPRIHNQLLPEVTNVEENFNQEIINGLIAMGHNVQKWNQLAEVQIVAKYENRTVEAYSDFRKYALADAY